MTYIFIDTNIFLEFVDLNNIEWKDVVNDDVQLIVTVTVINELDALKNNARKRIRTRASASLKFIEEVAIKKTYQHIQVLTKEPNINNFELYGLDPSIGDDRILQSIIEFQSICSEDCVLLSDDTGIRLKAIAGGIIARQLPKKYKLPNHKSEEEKELLTLRQENERLKSKKPKLKLVLGDGSIVYKKKLSAKGTNLNTKKLLDEIRLKHPRMQYLEDQVPKTVSGLVKGFSLSYPSKDKVDAYNEKLDQFYREYKTFLINNFENEVRFRNSVLLDIKLINHGTFPANNIDLLVSVPDLVLGNIYDHNLLSIEPPTPPMKPLGLIEFYRAPNIESLHFNETISPIDHDEPKITTTEEEYSVQYHISKVQHSLEKQLHPIWLFFTNQELLQNFSISYRFVADNHEKVEGKINIIFET